MKADGIDQLLKDQGFHDAKPNVRDIRRRRGAKFNEPGPSETSTYASPDGEQRSATEEHDLNEAFAITFAQNGATDMVLAYLRGISINSAQGPKDLNALELAHKAGQGYLQAIIEQRIHLGELKLPARDNPQTEE